MVPIVRSIPAALLCLAASLAGAQQPKPPPPPLSGIVLSQEGVPVADAEVSIQGSRRVTRTDTRGAFSIPDVPKGVQNVTVRRIGYLPALASVVMPQAAGTPLTVVLVAMHADLDTVKVTARQQVLGGIVVDENDRPIPGATVELAGSRRGSVTTGDDGWFNFTDVQNGPAVFRVLKEGYIGMTQSVLLDDWRGVVVHMTHLDKSLSATRRAILSGLGNTAKFVWTETQNRLLQRRMHAVIVTSDELTPLGNLPLGDAIMRAPSASSLIYDLQQNHNTVCILLNGNQMVGDASLDSYDASDVEFVELYPPGSEPGGSVGTHMSIAGCRPRPSFATNRMGIFYAVIWLKN